MLVQIYEVRITLISESDFDRSFKSLFYDRPIERDVIDSINLQRNTARIFKLISADSFIELVNKIGVPDQNEIRRTVGGDMIHLLTVNIYQVSNGVQREKPPISITRLERCCLCNKRPIYKPFGTGKKLFHDCPAHSGAPVIWFDDGQQWKERNAKLRERYKG